MKTSSDALFQLFGNKIKVTRSRNGSLELQIMRPRKPRKPSDAQRAANNRFSAAAAYAKSQMSDQERKLMYEEGVNAKTMSAYSVAMKDYLNAPTIVSINVDGYNGQAGDPIKVHARDDFKVARVVILIKDSSGRILEEGEALETGRGKHSWEYSAKRSCPVQPGTMVTATAFDHPGNKASLEQICSVQSLPASTKEPKVEKGRLNRPIKKSPKH